MTSIGSQPNLKDQAAQQIRRMIFSGRLKSGERIDQDSLAEDLSVSKLPIREALIVLQLEGLVQLVPRRGAYVAPLTEEDIKDHYEIFGIVSGLAASRAATTLTDTELDELGSLVDRMQASSDPSELEGFNFEFHRIINRSGSSHRLAAVLKQLSGTIPAGFFEFTDTWSEHAHADHRAILEALRERDGERASELLARHLRSSGDYAARLLENRGFWSSDGHE